MYLLFGRLLLNGGNALSFLSETGSTAFTDSLWNRPHKKRLRG
jgi:hypothetical protein